MIRVGSSPRVEVLMPGIEWGGKDTSVPPVNSLPFRVLLEPDLSLPRPRKNQEILLKEVLFRLGPFPSRNLKNDRIDHALRSLKHHIRSLDSHSFPGTQWQLKHAGNGLAPINGNSLVLNPFLIGAFFAHLLPLALGAKALLALKRDQAPQ